MGLLGKWRIFTERGGNVHRLKGVRELEDEVPQV
jgi:hypothetical protein